MGITETAYNPHLSVTKQFLHRKYKLSSTHYNHISSKDYLPLLRSINKSQLIHFITILSHEAHNLPSSWCRKGGTITRRLSSTECLPRTRRGENIEIPRVGIIRALTKLRRDPILRSSERQTSCGSTSSSVSECLAVG